jgi:prepilin-type N-terminal cleavage/methylation domain-containing protein
MNLNTDFKKGFTLIELLVVISIISLLSSIILGSVNEAREKARIISLISFDTNVFRTIGDELIGSWDFNDCSGTTVTDSSGNGNHGTFLAGSSWSNDSPFDSYVSESCSMRTNGTGSGVQTNIKNGNYDELTISAWFKSSGSNPPSGWHGIFMPQSTAGTGGPYMILSASNSGTTQIRTRTSNGHRLLNNRNTDVVDGEWHHLLQTYNGIEHSAYLDGEKIGSQSQTGTIVIDNGLIGKSYGPYFSNAYITNVKIYSKAFR